ncbi:MAG: EF-P lysine aminoacylase EpmA [Candidatus Wallbacteria bacterium]|nr:EF-P lysine aminoacylase EpmA [Candidatus Wallbacteria bacterium]
MNSGNLKDLLQHNSESSRTVPDILQKRFLFTSRAREFFRNRGYLEVETPALSPYATLDANIASFDTVFRHTPLYLQTSPEYYMKELLTMGFERIFQICKVFRNDETGPMHNPEFTMLEWYCTGHDYRFMMDETEDLVCGLAGEAADKWKRPFERLSVRDVFSGTTGMDLGRCLDYDALRKEAVNRDVGVTGSDGWDDIFFKLFLTYVEPSLSGRPVFLYDYPVKLGAMARPCPDSPGFAERFELYIKGCELCNGYSELNDSAVQRARFEHDLEARKRSGLPVPMINERFLSILPHMPDCTGNALGVDRLFMVINGLESIHEILPFGMKNHGL